MTEQNNHKNKQKTAENNCKLVGFVHKKARQMAFVRAEENIGC